jgi:hypothetical protein
VAGGITAQQRTDLLVRAHSPQTAKQEGHASWVVEGGS